MKRTLEEKRTSEQSRTLPGAGHSVEDPALFGEKRYVVEPKQADSLLSDGEVEDISQLERAITTWSSLENAFQHVQRNGHQYTDRSIVLAFQKFQLLATSAGQASTPLMVISQSLNDFLQLLLTKAPRPHPVATSILVEGLSQFQLPTVNLLLSACLTKDRDGSEHFDADYLIDLCEVYRSRSMMSFPIWMDAVRVAMAWKRELQWPLMLRLLKACPPRQEVHKILLPQVSHLLSHTSLSRFNHVDLLTLASSYHAIGEVTADSQAMVEEELVSRVAHLSAQDTKEMCLLLVNIPELSLNLSEALAHRFTRTPDQFDVECWLAASRLFHQVYFHPVEFFQHCVSALRPNLGKLSLNDALQVFSIFSKVDKSVPHCTKFLEVDVRQCLARFLPELSVSQLCRLMTDLSNTKLRLHALVGSVAECFVLRFDANVPGRNLMSFVSSLHHWAANTSRMPKLVVSEEKFVSGQLYPAVENFLTVLLSQKTMLNVEQASTLLSFLCMNRIFDFVIAGRVCRHLNPHLQHLDAKSLRQMFTLVEQSGYSDQKVNLETILRLSQDQVQSCSVMQLDSIVTVLSRMHSHGYNVKASLREIEKRINASRGALSGAEVCVCVA